MFRVVVVVVVFDLVRSIADSLFEPESSGCLRTTDDGATIFGAPRDEWRLRRSAAISRLTAFSSFILTSSEISIESAFSSFSFFALSFANQMSDL